jgi:hypothetical protein
MEFQIETKKEAPNNKIVCQMVLSPKCFEDYDGKISRNKRFYLKMKKSAEKFVKSILNDYTIGGVDILIKIHCEDNKTISITSEIKQPNFEYCGTKSLKEWVSHIYFMFMEKDICDAYLGQTKIDGNSEEVIIGITNLNFFDQNGKKIKV